MCTLLVFSWKCSRLLLWIQYSSSVAPIMLWKLIESMKNFKASFTCRHLDMHAFHFLSRIWSISATVMQMSIICQLCLMWVCQNYDFLLSRTEFNSTWIWLLPLHKESVFFRWLIPLELQIGLLHMLIGLKGSGIPKHIGLRMSRMSSWRTLRYVT